MQLSPSFTALPRIGRATINTANTNRDGTGTIATVFTASTSSTTSPGGGSRIDKVVVKALQTTTAGMVRLYTHDGTSAALLTEIPVAPVTVGANVAAFEERISFQTEIVSDFQNTLSGEGLLLSTFTGPGRVWLQTMPSHG